MEALIKIRDHAGKQIVSARDLHGFFEVKTDFPLWWEQLLKYGLYENLDYAAVVVKNGDNSQCCIGVSTDYDITTDAAKFISLLERSDKGNLARQYFKDHEKIAMWHAAIQLFESDEVLLKEYQDFLAQYNSKIAEINALIQKSKELRQKSKELRQKSEELRLQIQELTIAANFCHEVLNSNSTYISNTIASELGMSTQKLLNSLLNLGVLHRNESNNWVLDSKYNDCGYTKPGRTRSFQKSDGTQVTISRIAWTERGRYFIHGLFNKALAS